MFIYRFQRGRTAAHLAAGWGHAQCLRHLLHRGADAGKVSLVSFPCMQCVLHKSTSCGPFPSSYQKGGKTPLHDASGWGHDECLRLLLDAGASHETVDKVGYRVHGTALHTFALLLVIGGLDSTYGCRTQRSPSMLVSTTSCRKRLLD